MTVRVYRWDDASAPVLTGEVGKLTALLKACLVTGYGSKTAAGWSNPYSATNVEAFKNAAGGSQLGVKVTHAVAQYPRVAGFETIDGSGVITNQFPTEAQLSGGVYWCVSATADTTARPWMVVADEWAFYLYVGYDRSVAQGVTGATGYQMSFFAGDINSFKGGDAYPFLLIGGTSASASACSYLGQAGYTIGIAANGHYMARSYTQTGSAIQAGKMQDYGTTSGGGTIGAGSITYPDPVSGGMLLLPVRVCEVSVSVVRGEMPGLLAPSHALPGASGDTFSGYGALSGKTFILLDVANGATRGRAAVQTNGSWR